MLRALLIVCAIVAGQSAPAPPPAPGSLTGHVTTGTGPLRHARVVIDSPAGQVFAAHTDTTGVFRFDAVPPGRYRVRAIKLGFLPPVAASAPFTPALSTVDVAAARSATLDIRLDPSVTIEGVLVSARRGRLGRRLTQTILADRLVLGQNGETRQETYKGIVEDGGRFRLHSLPPGKYVLRVNAGFFGAPEWYYPGTGNRHEAQILEFVPGQAHAIGEFAQAEGAVPAGDIVDTRAPGSEPTAIEGRVLDEFGDPAPEMLVLLLERRFLAGRFRLYPRSSVSGSAQSFISVLTDERGRFRFTSLPPGDHYLVAVSDPFVGSSALMPDSQPRPQDEGPAAFAPTYFPNTTQGHEARPIALRAGETVRDVELMLHPAQTGNLRVNRLDPPRLDPLRPDLGREVYGLLQGLERLVSERPVTIVLVSGLDSRPADILYQIQVGELQPAVRAPFHTTDGSNVIRNLPIGDYVLWRGTETIPVSIVPGANTIDLLPRPSGPSLPASGPVNGRVVFDGPAPVPTRDQIEIVFELTDVGRIIEMGGIGTRAVAGFDEGWNFRLARRFWEWACVIRVKAPPSWALARVTASGANITDTPAYFGDAQTPGLEVVLTSRTGAVAGQVFDGDQPTSRHSVIVVPEDRERWGFLSRFVHVTRVDAQGQFELQGVLPGRYLALPLPNNTDEGADPEWLDSMRLAAVPVTVSEGETARIGLRVPR